MRRPNIIYIHSHDTGRFIQPYGAPVETPNLQQFADESVLFRQAFCANPTCSPSRTSLLTGQYPHVCGMFGLAHRGFEMPDYSGHLAAYLARQGYHTVLAGQQHEIAHGRESELGYSEFHGNNLTGLEEALAFLSRPNLPDPFFLSVGFFETHREFWPAGPEDRADRTAPPPGLPDTLEIREDMAQFKASARVLDSKIGLVLAELRRKNLLENSVVIVTTDHGIPFPGYKCNLTDNGLGVMLMMRLPDGQAAGRTVDGMVSHIDVFPTLCELADLPVPESVQGISMMPLVDGSAAQVHEEIFAEVNFHAAYEPMRCIRTERYKFIRRFSDRNYPVLENTDSSPGRTLWADSGWLDLSVESEELYDLILDPGEKQNLIHDASLSEVVEDLRTRLNQFMETTGDPLCEGPLVPPENARISIPAKSKVLNDK